MKTVVNSIDEKGGKVYYVKPKYAIGQKVFVVALSYRTIDKDKCKCCGYKPINEHIDEWNAFEATVRGFTITFDYEEDIRYECESEYYDWGFSEEMIFETMEQAQEACSYIVSKGIKDIYVAFEALKARNEYQQ